MGIKHSQNDDGVVLAIWRNDFGQFKDIVMNGFEFEKVIKVSDKLASQICLSQERGFTLLHVLVNFSRVLMIDYLLSTQDDLDVDIYDHFGYTGLMRAVKSSQDEIVQLLIDKGADPLKSNHCDGGDTSLHYACEIGNLTTALILINQCSTLDIKNQEGMTPLMYAIEHKNFKLTKTLIKMRADPRITDNNGFNSFDHARNCGFSEDVLSNLTKTSENILISQLQTKKLDSNDTFITLSDRSVVEVKELSKAGGKIVSYFIKGVDYLISDQISWV